MIFIWILVVVPFLLGNVGAAQDVAGSDTTEGVEQRPEDSGDSEYGYPDEGHPAGYVTDAEEYLNKSFPKKGSVFA